MSAPDVVTALTRLVHEWLPTQRWFAGKGRDITLRIESLADLSDEVTLWIAHVDYTEGGSELYQLPLVMRPEPRDQLDHALVGSVDIGSGPLWIYDALHDKDVTGTWLSAIRDERSEDRLSFSRYVEADEIPVGEMSLVLTGEQSNTSLMYGDVAILKVFRRLQPGVNPDIEIGAALGALGARSTPRLLGAVSADGYALAMLQEYLTTATDGWELAKASVRDLMAEADLHAEEAGGDFAGEAHRLGATVADVHADLAEAFGASPAVDLRQRADAMHARLEAAIAIVPALADLAPGLHDVFELLADSNAEFATQRIHGDLHLGQVLRTSYRWVVIDFEGEPMADLAERRRPDSPLRDIAGMLRSFDYAGHHRLIEVGHQPQLAYRAVEWATRNRDAFCDGYAEQSGTDPREHAAPLRAYEADKAVYEAVYEARNRPDWLPIPLATLARLAETPTDSAVNSNHPIGEA
jgi:maltokinase